MSARAMSTISRTFQGAIFLVCLSGVLPMAYAASCSVSASALSFGAYDPLAAAPNDSSTNVLVTCNNTLPMGSEVVNYTLSLTAGSGSYSARTMLRGATPIVYNLYVNASRATSAVWGDGTSGSVTVPGSLLPLSASTPVRTANHTLYGRIPALQDVPIGSYAASVILTMNF